jgi:hypothetical protein
MSSSSSPEVIKNTVLLPDHERSHHPSPWWFRIPLSSSPVVKKILFLCPDGSGCHNPPRRWFR